MDHLFVGIMAVTVDNVIMYCIGLFLILLAVKTDVSPAFFLPFGFGTILANLPFAPILTETSPVAFLLKGGLLLEALSLILLLMLGAMSDFSCFLRRPSSFIYSIPANLGLFAVLFAATALGFTEKQAAAIGILGSIHGPAAIYVATQFSQGLLAPLALLAYLGPLLLPVLQPPLIRLLTTPKERCLKINPMAEERPVSRRTKIFFSVGVVLLIGVTAPFALMMVCMLLFGNLLRESGLLILDSAEPKNKWMRLSTGLLGFLIGVTMGAGSFLRPEVAMLIGLSILAIVIDTASGVLCIKMMNRVFAKKVNPMLGVCGISYIPVAARIVADMALQEDKENCILPYAQSIHSAAGVTAVIIGGILLACL